MSTASIPTNPYLQDPEVQLMLRTQDGDDSAFAELVTSYQDRLTCIFYNMIHDKEAAEDLTQDVFFRIYRAKNGYKPTAKFSTWLFRIANNLALNLKRLKARRKEVQFGRPEQGELTTRIAENMVKDKSEFLAVRQIAKEEMKDVVRVAMETLNERQKLAVLLHKFEDMSYAEIAETMDMTIMGVKSLLSRARENIRMQLENHLKA